MATISDVHGHKWLLKLIQLRLYQELSLPKFCIEFEQAYERHLPGHERIPGAQQHLDNFNSIYRAVEGYCGEPHKAFENEPERSVDQLLSRFYRNYDFSEVRGVSIPL